MTIEVQQQQQRRGSQLPAGFRFHPTDEELIVHYLRKRASSSASASSPPWPGVIAEVDIYKLDPWELPSSNEQLGNNGSTNNECMYFFSPRDRKYPNGVRPNRAAGSGYWKATGTDKPIVSSSSQGVVVGVKKALVFYQGRPPKGIKTNWIMHEYRLADARPHAYRPPPTMRSSSSSSSSSMRLDDWVLCRIYKKPDPQLSQLLLHHDHQLPSSSSMDSQQQQQHQQDHYDSSSSTSRMPMPMPMSMSMPRPPSISDYLEDYSAVSHLFDTLPPPDTGAGFVLSDDEASTTRKRDNSDNGGVVDTMRASKRSMFGPDQLTMNSNFSLFGPDQHQLLPANSSKDRM